MLRNLGSWCLTHPLAAMFVGSVTYLYYYILWRVAKPSLLELLDEARWRWRYRRSHGSLRRRSR